MVDFLFVIIELFSLCLFIYLFYLRLRRYKRKSLEVGVFRRGWVTLSANFRQKGRRPPTTVGVRKLEWLHFRVVSKYSQCIVWFCHKARVTDGQTDGQNYDSQDRTSIAASRGNQSRVRSRDHLMKTPALQLQHIRTCGIKMHAGLQSSEHIDDIEQRGLFYVNTPGKSKQRKQ